MTIMLVDFVNLRSEINDEYFALNSFNESSLKFFWNFLILIIKKVNDPIAAAKTKNAQYEDT